MSDFQYSYSVHGKVRSGPGLVQFTAQINSFELDSEVGRLVLSSFISEPRSSIFKTCCKVLHLIIKVTFQKFSFKTETLLMKLLNAPLLTFSNNKGTVTHKKASICCVLEIDIIEIECYHTKNFRMRYKHGKMTTIKKILIFFFIC